MKYFTGSYRNYLIIDFFHFCLFKSVDLTIDESSFTGETEPSAKITEQNSGSNNQFSQRRNIGFMGTLVKSGYGKVMHEFFLLIFCL
jgi:magnesium-transporting ATPase (P-type)